MAGTCQIARKWLLVFSARFSESWRPAPRGRSSAKDRLLPSAAWMKCGEKWILSRILGCLVAKLLIPSVSIASIQCVKWQVRGRLICSFICWVPHPVFCFSPSPSPLEAPKKVLKAAGLLGDGGGVTLAPLGKPAAISHDSKWREKWRSVI